MGIASLVKMSVTLAIIAATTGKLPKILEEVRKAQFELLKRSRASIW
jgi:hypothetical protein